jgi:hypothetical protein
MQRLRFALYNCEAEFAVAIRMRPQFNPLMAPSIFDESRSACAEVADRAHVGFSRYFYGMVPKSREAFSDAP